MADIIKATRGLKIDFEEVPLLLGEPGLATDEERLYIGGNNGNIPLPNAADLSENTQNLNTHLADLITDSDGVHGLKIESGIFNPVIAGATIAGANTYAAIRGRYDKIGKQVTVFIDIGLSAKDSAMAGGVIITGLPYVPINDVNYKFSASVGLYYGFNFPANCYNLMATLNGGASQIGIMCGNANVTTGLDSTNITNNFRIILQLTYLTT